MIEVDTVQVARLRQNRQNNLYVLLKGAASERTLFIRVSESQAEAIQMELDGIRLPRPMTHDLFKNVLDVIGWKLVRVEVSDLRPDPLDMDKGTFYARLVLARDGSEVIVDARPSDAIALALRCSCRICVEESVLEKAGINAPVLTERPGRKAGVEPTPLALLEGRLGKAVKAERYEDAAALRDQIKAEHLKQKERTGN